MGVDTSPWWELRIEVPTPLAEDAAALLIDGGALGAEHAVEVPEDGWAFAGDVETPPSSDRVELCVSYDGTMRPEDVCANAVTTLRGLGIELDAAALLPTRREDADWSERWKEYFHPLQIGRRLWIVPSWEENFEPPEGALILSLDPGMAFGTGQHGTTSLCGEAIEEWVESIPNERREQVRLIDVGCGSGILAIAAAKLGLRGIVALDNDPQAVDATRENTAGNGVQQQVHATGQPIEDIGGTFDCVVANILAVTLIPMSETLVRRVAPGGRLILSGILAEQADEVQSTYEAVASAAARPLRLRRRAERGEWVALIFDS